MHMQRETTASISLNEVDMCTCVCVRVLYWTSSYLCVCMCGRWYSVSAAGSTQAAAAERERMKEKRRLHKKERLREVPAQAPSLQGLSSCRVKAPIERKQGHLNSAAALRTQTHTSSHTLMRNNTRASVSAASAQQPFSGSQSCLDLQLCAKNNKDQDNVGTDMQLSPFTLLCLQNLPFTWTDTLFVRYCR